MAMFSGGGFSFPDFLFFVFFLLLACFSTPLNYLVFRHNYYKRPSIARNLYLILSGTDLLAGAYLSLWQSINFITPPNPACWDDTDQKDICEDRYYLYITESPGFWYNLHSVLKAFFTLTPILTTSVLTITRYLQIKFPLFYLPKKLILGGLALATVYTPAIITFLYVTGGNGNIYFTFLQFTQALFDDTMDEVQKALLVYTPFILVQIAGLVFSILTVGHLIWMVKNPVGGTAMSMTSTLRVLAMNTISCIYLAISIAAAVIEIYTSEHSEDWGQLVEVVQNEPIGVIRIQFVSWIIMPPLTSLLDAVVYLAFSREARRVRRRAAVPVVVNRNITLTEAGKSNTRAI